MKILFVASEGVPFSKTGGLADVVGALPKVLAAREHQVSVLLPRYRSTAPGEVVHAGLSIPLGSEVYTVDIQEGPTVGKVRHFFVDYPPFFDRESLYMDGGKDYPDNAERFALFAKAALEFAHRDGLPDVLHCHDWQSALVPVYLKTEHADDPDWRSVAVIFTVHNMGYPGLFPAETRSRIGLPDSLFTMEGLEYWGQINFLKGGLLFADHITTVSKRYAQEIQTEEYGCGLDGVVRTRADHLTGILNGVDYTEWNPETDKFLAAPYSVEQMEGKQACKKDLLAQFKLPPDRLKRPLIGIVSRFATQKGFDLLAAVAPQLMRQNLQLVALGTGEPQFEELFRELAVKFPRKFAVRVAYDNALAHKIEGGSDMLLMPSRYEPCGLNQIYSLRYGTVPVVRATGGLDDTIELFDGATGAGTGFKFQEYSPAALLDCLSQALALFSKDAPAWRQLVYNGMVQDFSWDVSAGEYEALYRRVVKRLRSEYNRPEGQG
jgi:starch synthase